VKRLYVEAGDIYMRTAKRLATLLCVFLSIPSWSQKFTGTLTGIVTDPTGAVVGGATVRATSKATGATRTTTTNAEGSFTFPELNPDTYDVSISKSGFKEAIQRDVALHVADNLAVTIHLTVGAAGEMIEVQGVPSEVALQTQSGEVSNVMLSQQVRELPLNGRSFVQLTTLVPGASVGESFDNKNKGLFSGVDISFSGSPSVDNQWTVDGAANNDIGSQRTILIYPSIDGIDEFKIQRNSYGPEYGGASGAQINIVTKSGTNTFHGDVFYSGRNDVLNARDFFLGQCTTGGASCRKQILRRNDYGYTFGGPIKKNKAFFFWSQEWNAERRGRVHAHCVPTEAERNGDFSIPDCASAPVPLDPATGLPFPGNKIPANRLSPAGQAYISPLPLPNITDPAAANNWVTQVLIPVDWREELIRGDLNLTKNNTLTMRYTQDKWLNFKHADEAAGLWGDSDFPALSDNWNQPGKMAVAKLTTTLSNTAVNDFQFSWSGNRIYITRGGDDPTLNDQINAVLPRIFPYSDKLNGDKVGWPQFWAGTTPSGELGIISPWKNRQDLFVWKDDFSKVAGKHTFKAGFLYSRNAKDEEVGDEYGELWGPGDAQGPAVDYNGPGWSNATFGTGNYYADYLLKGMTFGYDETQRDNFSLVRWRDYELYGGDTWKVARRLTLNYGARWSFIRAPFLEDNQLAGFSAALYASQISAPVDDPCRGEIIAKGGNGSGCAALGSVLAPPQFENRTLVHNNNHMISPRIGLAWDVFGSGRFVLRGGVGQFTPRDRLLAISMRSSDTPFGVGTGAVLTLDGNRVAYPGDSPGGVDCVTNGCVFGAALSGAPHQGLDPSTNQANSWQWNLTTETALWTNSKLELAWVANRGIHLQNAFDANQIPKAFRLEAAQLAVTGGDTTSLHPYPYNSSGQLTIWSHTGDNIYHSLQAMFTTRMHRNSIFQAAYTFSKNLGNTTFGYVDTNTVFSDNTNTRTNRGPVDFDRRHVFSANLIYNFPEFPQWNAAARQVIGGWETSTIVNYASGNALTVNGNNGLGDATGTATTGGLFTQRPLRVYSQPCHLSSSPRGQWLNPAAFTWSGYQLGTFGNSGPGQCPGPPVNNVDFSIDKNWNIPFLAGAFSEKARLQFRMDFFNLFNHPQFKFGGQNLAYDATGMNPVDASGTDCAANPTTCVAITGGTVQPGFGRPNFVSQVGNREIQYGLKLIF
jgi:Carboxypeptidase regulatory-like domain